MTKKNLIIALCVLALALPALVSAADAPSQSTPVILQSPPGFWPIVPCGLNIQPDGISKSVWDYTQPCNQCLLIVLVKHIIDLIVEGVVPILGTFFFLLGGFMILGGADKPGRIGDGKKLMWATAAGIAIIFSSWLITNFILKSLAGDSDVATKWNQISCQVSTLEDIVNNTAGFPTVGGGQPGPAPAPVPPPGGVVCSNPAQLASQYKVPIPAKNSNQLNALISCVTSNVGNLIDQSQVYTYERQNNLCNFTRGNAVCGACAHSKESCHYGGKTGSAGAEAVDFNAKNQNLETQLYQELLKLKGTCNFGYILFEADHTHVSTQSCSGN